MGAADEPSPTGFSDDQDMDRERTPVLSRLDPELRRLFSILREHPEGLREYDLLEILRGDRPLRGLDSLEVFRVHFLLFHHLHRLRQALQTLGLGTLEIHCLRVRLAPLESPAPNREQLPRPPDPLEGYYLDLENMARTTREDVQEMLRWFWRRYRVHGRREEAMAALGLGPETSLPDARRRYRALVREHHPDRGGDAAAFRKVVEAMEVLRLLSE